MCQAIRELMEDARNEGIEREMERGIENFVAVLQELGVSYSDTMQKLREKYNLTEDKICECMELYWK